MLFQDWWQTQDRRTRTAVAGLLAVVLKQTEDARDEDRYAIASCILESPMLLAQDSREAFLDEFLIRFTPTFDYLSELVIRENIQADVNILKLVSQEANKNIEIKAAILGLLLQQSNSLANLAALAKKMIHGTVVDHESDLRQLQEQARQLEKMIKLYQSNSEETELFEWEIDLEGCPHPDCHHKNPPLAEVCERCGLSLRAECPDCYNEIPISSSYCRCCGKQDMENWNLFARLLLTIRIELSRERYNSAANLLEQIPEEFRRHPDLMTISQDVSRGCDRDSIDHLNRIKQEIAEKTAILRQRWLEKIEAILADERPDLIVASKAFEWLPPFLIDERTDCLREKLQQKRQEVVRQGRSRKRSLLLQKADFLAAKGQYQEALAEVDKITGPLQDERTEFKRRELKVLAHKQQELQSLQQGPDWAKPGDSQKNIASERHLPVAQEIDLGSEIKLRFLLIPPGEFWMGSDSSYENERPRHKVLISAPFYLGITPVTQEQWQVLGIDNRSDYREAKLPVHQVSWDDCARYLLALTKKFRQVFRLPTEAEWEYSCRAGSIADYCSQEAGKQLGDYAWFNKNSGQQPQAVATKNANAWGLYDLHGNINEWCQDCYAENYYRKSPLKDPMGPIGDKNHPRVYRGGSWKSIPSDLRCSVRHGLAPGQSDATVGFRLVLMPPRQPKKSI